MSAFEVAGVVLGVLPLVISAIESYEKIIDPIVIYRSYSEALKTFTTELNVQRDIFQNECIWILSRFVDGHELEEMLKDPSHQLRENIQKHRSLDRSFLRTIGPSYQQILDILQLIKSSLDDIYEETKDLSLGLSIPTRSDGGSVDLKGWHRHVHQKMKLSFRKPSLNEKINELRHRNQAFLAISQQIVRFNAYAWNPVQTQWDEQSTDKNLEKIQKLRTASDILYHRLERLWSCPDHPDHSANIQLCLSMSELFVNTSSKISFDMALTYWDFEQPAPISKDPILIVIESAIEELGSGGNLSNKPAVRFNELPSQGGSDITPIKRQSSGLVVKESRRARFRKALKVFKGEESGARPSSTKQKDSKDTKAPGESAVIPPTRLQNRKQAEASLADLGSVPNLCTRILELSQPGSLDRKLCMGYFSGQGAEKYLVYGRQPAKVPFAGAMSLSALIGDQQRPQTLPKPAKWRLAGSLSMAVLLYHSTPWLQKSWKSDDILFFNFSGPERSDTLQYPHLHSFPRINGKKSRMQSSSDQTWTKNDTLYHLGIMLLELEFEDTLENLIAKSKLKCLPQTDAMLTHRLTLLKRRAGEQLGTLYGRIVRMCLDCDFGLGLDEYTLEDPRVQRIFYSQIVRQFQERMPEYSKIWDDS